jgi:hypothetical protein
LGVFEPPKISENVAKRVRNLVVYEEDVAQLSLEQYIVNDILEVFSGVKVLVMADRLHSVEDVGKELVWLRGELGDESRWLSELQAKEGINQEGWANCEPQGEQEYRWWLGNLLLWIDKLQYGSCVDIAPSLLEGAWETRHGDGREMPTIFRKSVTTAEVKNKLLQICGSEDDFRKLEGLDWGFVQDEHRYHGILDLSRQIAFLELVLHRIPAEYTIDDCWNTAELEGIDQIASILVKIRALRHEKKIRGGL